MEQFKSMINRISLCLNNLCHFKWNNSEVNVRKLDLQQNFMLF